MSKAWVRTESEVGRVLAVGYVVEQLLNGSEDERVARERARRRRTAREERKALRREARTSAPRPVAAVPPPVSSVSSVSPASP